MTEPIPVDGDALYFDVRSQMQRLRKRALPALLLATLAAAGATVYTYVVPPEWVARVSIVLPMPDELPAAALAGAFAKTTPLSIATGIVSSPDAYRATAIATDLPLPTLLRKLHVNMEESSNQISLQFTHRDADFATKVVTTHLDITTKMASRLTLDRASRQSEEIGRVLEAKNNKIGVLRQRLLSFQRTSKSPTSLQSPYAGTEILNELKKVEIEVRATKNTLELARSLALQAAQRAELPTNFVAQTQNLRQMLRASLADKETRLEEAQITYADTSPLVKRLRAEVEVARIALEKESEREAESVSLDIDANVRAIRVNLAAAEARLKELQAQAEAAPAEAEDLSALMQQLEIESATYKELAVRYESLVVDSRAARVRWGPLAPPSVEDKPANKNYAVNALSAFVLMFLGSIVVFVVISDKPRRTTPYSPNPDVATKR